MRGHTLVELLIAVTLLGTALAVAVPPATAALDAARARGAAFFIASRFALARTQAVHRGANVAIRFRPAGSGFAMETFLDGNGNGVRSVEIASGVDPSVSGPDRLEDLFSGARFGIVAGATLIDGTPVAEGSDPIRFGPADMLTFTPSGTATPGTAYVRANGRWQYAVVVLGATGRTRIAHFDVRRGTWVVP